MNDERPMPRLPGARSPTPEPRAMKLPPAIEVLYPQATLNVGTTDNGGRILQVTIVGIPPTIMLFPMDADAARGSRGWGRF